MNDILLVLCAEAASLSKLRGLNRHRLGVTRLQKEVVDKYRFFGHDPDTLLNRTYAFVASPQDPPLQNDCK